MRSVLLHYSGLCNASTTDRYDASSDHLPKMTPQNETGNETCAADGEQQQYLFLIRHGDRWDYSNPGVGYSELVTRGITFGTVVGLTFLLLQLNWFLFFFSS